MKGAGVPDALLNLVHNLHTNTGVRAHFGSQFSLPFYTTSGVWQECILVPALFSQMISWKLGLAASHIRITVGQEVITH